MMVIHAELQWRGFLFQCTYTHLGIVLRLEKSELIF